MSPKKLKKASALTISIEPQLFDEFDKYTQENFIDKSKLVEHLIKKYIQLKKKK
jgi:metal-responsive CopG/Arc/MetJ family transcriptional regulator